MNHDDHGQAQPPYLSRVEFLIPTRPYLSLLRSFLLNPLTTNSACRDRRTLSRRSTLLSRHSGRKWIAQDLPQHLGPSPWLPQSHVSADIEPSKSPAHIILLDHLTPDLVQSLGTTFNIDPSFFHAHINGSEQHHRGYWGPSALTHPGPLLSERVGIDGDESDFDSAEDGDDVATGRGRYFSVDFRRAYSIPTRVRTSLTGATSVLRSRGKGPSHAGSTEKMAKGEGMTYFDRLRVETCSVLRSFHSSGLSGRILQGERLTGWIGKGPGNWGDLVILLCDPVIPTEEDDGQQHTASPQNTDDRLSGSDNAYHALPKSLDKSIFGRTLQHILSSPRSLSLTTGGNAWTTALIAYITKLMLHEWVAVAMDMEHQVSQTEDQVEEDFWHRRLDPHRVLRTVQRLSRRLESYVDNVHMATITLRHVLLLSDDEDDNEGKMHHQTNSPTSIVAQTATTRTQRPHKTQKENQHWRATFLNLNTLHHKFLLLSQRAHRAIPSLSASNTMEETKRTNRLTMVALLFAPLSLIASFLSIDGRSSIGGTKYWIFIAVAVPAAVLIVAFSKPFQQVRWMVWEGKGSINVWWEGRRNRAKEKEKGNLQQEEDKA